MIGRSTNTSGDDVAVVGPVWEEDRASGGRWVIAIALSGMTCFL